MQVIHKHRERVSEFGRTFGRLLAMERELYDLRSKSWGLQMAGSNSRESDLHEVHEVIEQKMLEVANLRQMLTSPAASRTATQA